MSTTFDYQEYLASREWALLKNQVRERSGGTCERCGKAPHQSTHHKTYARVGRERLDDLLGVCNPCHEFLSGKSNDDPATVIEEPPVIHSPGSPSLDATPIRWSTPSWMGLAAQQLACPICGYEYVHVVDAVWMSTGERDYQAGWVRGKSMQVHFWCESSHHFSIDIGFHKGGTFVRYGPDWGTYDPSDQCEICKAAE